MPEFHFHVSEAVRKLKLYVVEARDLEEAQEKAMIGDTEDEIFLKNLEVYDREVLGQVDHPGDVRVEGLKAERVDNLELTPWSRTEEFGIPSMRDEDIRWAVVTRVYDTDLDACLVNKRFFFDTLHEAIGFLEVIDREMDVTFSFQAPEIYTMNLLYTQLLDVLRRLGLIR